MGRTRKHTSTARAAALLATALLPLAGAGPAAAAPSTTSTTSTTSTSAAAGTGAAWSTSAAWSAQPGLRVTGASVRTEAPAQVDPWQDDCFAGASKALCGYGLVTVELSGFDAYGGIPSCDPAEPGWSPETCELPVASLVRTAGTRVDLLVRCEGRSRPTRRTVAVATEPSALALSDAGAMTRLDSDSAEVAIAFYLPRPSQVRACEGPSQLLAATARHVTVSWSGQGAVPAGRATLRGTHRFPLG
ncbi:hypothetical protein [Kineococcus indalonis]|uniref:hypothetical protein n=1 Tax=Kineococcus indalonis TaxID=2696566 RepID=UPI0014132FCC|nr:hypothetical protein [Kineococcus indalonis]NAZ86114.1 hypothetical protein [Kineococcus indalonis]